MGQCGCKRLSNPPEAGLDMLSPEARQWTVTGIPGEGRKPGVTKQPADYKGG